MAHWSLTLSGNGTDEKSYTFKLTEGYTLRLLKNVKDLWSLVPGEWIDDPVETSLGQLGK